MTVIALSAFAFAGSSGFTFWMNTQVKGTYKYTSSGATGTTSAIARTYWNSGASASASPYDIEPIRKGTLSGPSRRFSANGSWQSQNHGYLKPGTYRLQVTHQGSRDKYVDGSGTFNY